MNDDPGLTLIKARSNLAAMKKKCYKVILRENLAANDLIFQKIYVFQSYDPKALSAPAPGLYTCT